MYLLKHGDFPLPKLFKSPRAVIPWGTPAAWQAQTSTRILIGGLLASRLSQKYHVCVILCWNNHCVIRCLSIFWNNHECSSIQTWDSMALIDFDQSQQ